MTKDYIIYIPLYFITKMGKGNKNMKFKLLYYFLPILAFTLNVYAETPKYGWHEEEYQWVLCVKINPSISIISGSPDSHTTKFITRSENKHLLEDLQRYLIENKPHIVEYVLLNDNENEKYSEVLISLSKEAKYKVEKINEEVYIRVQRINDEKVTNYISELKNTLAELTRKEELTEKSKENDILNTLDTNLSRIKKETDIKIAKYIKTDSNLITSPETLAQPNQDLTGSQSLSVGNIGFQDKRIEIREAEPVEEPRPQSEEKTQEQPQEEEVSTETTQVPSSPPSQEKEMPQKATTPQEVTQENAEQLPTPPSPRESTVEQATEATAEITRELRALEEPQETKPETPPSPEIPPKAPVTPATETKTPPQPTEQQLPPPPTIKPSPKGLDTIIDFECEKMPLSKLVPLLAYKAGINVIAGTDLKGDVTMSLKKVTLRDAIEAALRMNGLGLLQEENIYRIVPYEEAIASDRTTIVVKLENAKASEVRKVLEEISKGTKGSEYITISANDTTNVVIVSGPEEFIQGLAQMAKELDIAKPVIPTVTTTIKLNYADPDELAKSLQKIITPKTGNVSADARARHIIVTDMPVVVEQIKEIVKSLDVPVKQVLIDSMVVDATLDDEAQTGIDWLMKAVRHQSWRDFVMYGPEGRKIGNLQQLELGGSTLMGETIGSLTFNILTNEIDWKGVIQAEVRNRNGHLVSNPVVATVENKPATITISQEIPYIDLTQTSQGGALTNTRFKQVGTILEVTPRVTHDNHIIVDIKGKESVIVGEFNGIPIEDLRQVTSTLHINSGQTIFVGGLRKRNDSATIKKIPVLGDIPVLNLAFKTNQRKAQVNELLIFLTCSVMEQELPELTPEQKDAYDAGKNAPMKTDVGKYIGHDILKPKDSSLPPYKWKRAKKTVAE
ncbi:MAG: hypothetical protein N3G21_10105 [Candidatus Hydrogenedentes bacterium]|nr:hypothetical protein [Candidatus Hydrogenedentota bacterium]